MMTRRTAIHILVAGAVGALAQSGSQRPPQVDYYEERLKSEAENLNKIRQILQDPAVDPALKGKLINGLVEQEKGSLTTYQEYEAFLKTQIRVLKGLPADRQIPEVQGHIAWMERRLPQVQAERRRLEALYGGWVSNNDWVRSSAFGWVAITAKEIGEPALQALMLVLNKPLGAGGQEFLLARQAANTASLPPKQKLRSLPFVRVESGPERRSALLTPPPGLHILPMVRAERVTLEGGTLQFLRQHNLLQLHPLELDDHPAQVIYPTFTPVGNRPQTRLMILQGSLASGLQVARYQSVPYNNGFLNQWMTAFMQEKE